MTWKRIETILFAILKTRCNNWREGSAIHNEEDSERFSGKNIFHCFLSFFLTNCPPFYVKIDYSLIYCWKKKLRYFVATPKSIISVVRNFTCIWNYCGKNDIYKKCKKLQQHMTIKRKLGQLKGFRISITWLL